MVNINESIKSISGSFNAESGEDTDEIIALLSFMDVSFDEFLITVLLSDFDEVGEVTIPEEVIAAAVETGSPVPAGG